MGRKFSRRQMLSLSATTTAAVVAGYGVDKLVTSSPSSTPSPKASPRPVAARHHRASVTEAEYNKRGDPDWRVKNLGVQRAVEAYTDKSDVLPGESFQLFISSTSNRVRVEAFRMGWYGGAHARRVWSKDRVHVGLAPAPSLTSGVNTITTSWQPTLTVPTDGWPEGSYLIRLTTAGGQRYVPFVVRSTDSAGKLLLVHATTTWQAYNTWGGYSLYQGPGVDYDTRARVVSFDRPYDGNGAIKYLAFERPVASLVDKLRLPVAYTTSEYVHSDPQLLNQAKAVISLGHDEYWSTEMRANVTAARDAGVNIAFLGANACFRRIRYEHTSLGSHRRVVCYKTDYMSDPDYGVHNKQVTNDFREPPDPDPECSLTGTYYEGYPANGDYVVYSPDSWLFKGTGVSKGTSFGDLIGPEYDRTNPVVKLPRPFQVLSHSPIIFNGVHTYSDSAYYTTKSGAGVFNAGSMRWTGALLHIDRKVDKRTATFADTVTGNLLKAFSHGPAAERYPATDNLDVLNPYVGDPAANDHNLW